MNLLEQFPSELGMLSTSLFDIWLAYNHLTGTLPITVGFLTKLQYLHLEYNMFSGTLPSEIGNLSLLSDFHLGTNKISGTIPDEVATLSDLGKYYNNVFFLVVLCNGKPS